MARRLLREIAKEDGADANASSCFANCCINILQMGCSYPKGVEKKIQRLLGDRKEKVCVDIVMRMHGPRGGMKKVRKLGTPPPGYTVRKDTDGFPYFVRDEKSQHANNRKRWRSRSPDRNDRKRTICYEDKNPHGYNQYRPRSPNQRQQYRGRNQKRRRYNKPNTDKMGRMGTKR